MICVFGLNVGTALLAYLYSSIGKRVSLYASKDLVGDVYSFDLLHLWSLGILESRTMARFLTYDYLTDVLNVRIVEVNSLEELREPSECDRSLSSYEVDPESLEELLRMGAKPVEIVGWPGLTLERGLATGRVVGRPSLFDEDLIKAIGLEIVEGDRLHITVRVPKFGERIGLSKIDSVSGSSQSYARDLVLVRDAYRVFYGKPKLRELVVEYAVGKNIVVFSLGGSKSSMPKDVVSRAHFSRTSFNGSICKMGVVGKSVASLQYVGPPHSIGLMMALATILEERLDPLIPTVVEHPRFRSVISTPYLSLLLKLYESEGSGGAFR